MNADECDCLEVAGQIADAVECYEGEDLLGQITPALQPLIGELQELRKENAELRQRWDHVVNGMSTREVAEAHLEGRLTEVADAATTASDR
jgi:hypothetical protein